jgi:DNA-binding transcriptional LysR family regulator
MESAKQLHLTQSTVSVRIQRLEEELGARLTEKAEQGIWPSYAPFG